MSAPPGCVAAMHAHVGQCYRAGRAEGEAKYAALVAAVEGLCADPWTGTLVNGFVPVDSLRAVLAAHADLAEGDDRG